MINKIDMNFHYKEWPFRECL